MTIVYMEIVVMTTISMTIDRLVRRSRLLVCRFTAPTDHP